MPLCTRSAASSAPAPLESSDTTMMSAGATGSSTTSAHPAARRPSSRTKGMARRATTANATTRLGIHFRRFELTLRSMGLLHEGLSSVRLSHEHHYRVHDV